MGSETVTNALKTMIIMRKLLVIAAAACAAVGAKIGIDRLRRSSRAESTIADLRRRGHHLAGQAKGVAYHTLRRPRPGVGCDVTAGSSRPGGAPRI
jgi:hypothetical protein